MREETMTVPYEDETMTWTKHNPPPWETEPDHVITEAHGFVIEIKRHPTHKHLNGYIYIEGDELAKYCEAEVDVHGGWTHESHDEPADMYTFGFDCAHAGDYCPGMELYHKDDIYRTMDFVLNELQVVAKKLADKMSARKEKQDE